jgi:hypothetical protein
VPRPDASHREAIGVRSAPWPLANSPQCTSPWAASGPEPRPVARSRKGFCVRYADAHSCVHAASKARHGEQTEIIVNAGYWRLSSRGPDRTTGRRPCTDFIWRGDPAPPSAGPGPPNPNKNPTPFTRFGLLHFHSARGIRMVLNLAPCVHTRLTKVPVPDIVYVWPFMERCD